MVELDILPQCDDETLPEHSALQEVANLVIIGARKIGRPYRTTLELQAMMEQAGFTDIKRTSYRCPSNGRWPKDALFKRRGYFLFQALESGFDSLLRKMLCEQFRWPRQDVEHLLFRARRELADPTIHAYFQA